MCTKEITKKEEVISLFKQGCSPKEITQKIDRISFKRVMDYLFIQAGEGNIRMSDIWFSINHNIRETIEKARSESYEISVEGLLEYMNIYELHKDEFLLYKKLEKARVAHGDMYELISEIELLLHRAIKKILIKTFGPAETEWWQKGVPINIRKQCAVRKEEDDEPARELFCYITFIDLKEILDKKWPIFKNLLPKNIENDKQSFLSKLVRVNKIRNLVMHPSKEYDFKPKDFDFIYNFHAAIKKDKWQDKEIIK